MTRTINNSIKVLHEPQRGSDRKCWVLRWYGAPDELTGIQKRYGRLFRHKREAEARAAEMRSEFTRGAARDPVTVTLAELIAEFEQARLASLSYASRISYENTTKQLLGYFGRQRLIREILQRHAEGFLATRKRCDRRPEELSSWAKRRHLINARALFNAAVTWGYVPENPFRVSRAMGASPLRLNPKGKPWHHLKPEEFRRLLAVVTSARSRAMYWLMYGCGLRFGEAANVTVGNIDLDNQRVQVVNRAASENVPPFTVKAEGQSATSKERYVPIPDAALPDLTDAMKGAFKSGGFVTITPKRYEIVREHWRLCREYKPWGGHVWRPWQNRDLVINVLRDTKNFLRRAKVELNGNFNLNAFRKSYAQNLANAGTPPRTLAQLLGHADTRVTMAYYNRVTDENERAAGEVMNRLLAGEAEQKRKQGS